MAKAKQALTDMYINRVGLKLMEPAASTGIISQFQSSYTSQDRVAMEIKRIDYWCADGQGFEASHLAAAGDGIEFGVTQLYRGGTIPSVYSHEGLVDYKRLSIIERTAVGFEVFHNPISTVLNDPVIAHPASLYAFVRGISIATLINVWVNVWYKLIDINDPQWQEIWESILIRDRI